MIHVILAEPTDWNAESNKEHSNDAMKACLQNQLESAGLDKKAMEMMDKEERRQVIESANLDPNEYESFWK